MAPEVVGGEEIDAKADVWSIGVMLYLLITGEIAENSSDLVYFYFDEPVWGYFTDELRSFVECCLEVNSSKRVSVSDLAGLPFMEMYRDR
jgi:serine/threonine protein kinase